MTRTLVVARYTEDLGWLTKLPSDWKPLVVYKDVDVPNEGREASSYFYALAQLRSNGLRAHDTIAFCQGDPFAHNRSFLRQLGKVHEFTWMGSEILYSDDHGIPHHPGLPVGEMFDRWIGGPRPDRYRFAPGAQFAIPGTSALKHNVAFYEQMFAEANQGNAPWTLERLWEHFWPDTN